ncbi:unnamed protein product [Arctia plantaginis]|uniref:Uncharacterized protein n=1 Tax=Arctia plantaginis TaxID=874455 RepID=A0A8S0YV92_ARCPL|nr:unnamed protein product [Arctia plantaginis]
MLKALHVVMVQKRCDGLPPAGPARTPRGGAAPPRTRRCAAPTHASASESATTTTERQLRTARVRTSHRQCAGNNTQH